MPEPDKLPPPRPEDPLQYKILYILVKISEIISNQQEMNSP